MDPSFVASQCTWLRKRAITHVTLVRSDVSMAHVVHNQARAARERLATLTELANVVRLQTVIALSDLDLFVIVGRYRSHVHLQVSWVLVLRIDASHLLWSFPAHTLHVGWGAAPLRPTNAREVGRAPIAHHAVFLVDDLRDQLAFAVVAAVALNFLIHRVSFWQVGNLVLFFN